MQKNRVLIITPDSVGKYMAGPAMRHYHIARVLARQFEVTLCSAGQPDISEPAFQILPIRNGRQLYKLAQKADIIFTQGGILEFYPVLKLLSKPLIIDLFCPFMLEYLEFIKSAVKRNQPHIPSLGFLKYRYYLNMIREQLRQGDFFICGDEAQLKLWTGMLLAEYKLNPYSYDNNADLKRLIQIVPFGISEPPVFPAQSKLLRTEEKGFSKEDFILLWGGGIWNWFDPLTVIKAMAEIYPIEKRIKLLFPGTDRPQGLRHQMAQQAIDLAKQLDLYDKTVFFFKGWVPYEDRPQFWSECDVGISSHFNTVETKFAVRTRAWDYIGAALPMITTRGDMVADLVEKYQVGLTCDFEQVKDWKKAILKMVQEPKFYQSCRQNLKAVKSIYSWEKVCEPVVSYCQAPYLSADKLNPGQNLINGTAQAALGAYITLKRWIKIALSRF